MANYIGFINHLWLLNSIERFNPSERDLLFYLLNEANKQYWQMPVRCATNVVCSILGLSKVTVLRAREKLRQRGLISFSEGIQNSRAPAYTITINVTARETAYETVRETDNKNKDISTSKSNEYNTMLGLEELETKLKADEQWKQNIIDLLDKEGNSLPPDVTLETYIDKFFSFLRINGYEKREEKDCRSHFYNKLVKDYLKQNKCTDYGIHKQAISNKRKGTNAPDASAQDYNAPF